jgi:hypothetical protein
LRKNRKKGDKIQAFLFTVCHTYGHVSIPRQRGTSANSSPKPWLKKGFLRNVFSHQFSSVIQPILHRPKPPIGAWQRFRQAREHSRPTHTYPNNRQVRRLQPNHTKTTPKILHTRILLNGLLYMSVQKSSVSGAIIKTHRMPSSACSRLTFHQGHFCLLVTATNRTVNHMPSSASASHFVESPILSNLPSKQK